MNPDIRYALKKSTGKIVKTQGRKYMSTRGNMPKGKPTYSTKQKAMKACGK
jgi:hypothetical protein